VNRAAVRLLAGPCLLALTLSACSSKSTPAADGAAATGTPSAVTTSAATTAPSAAATTSATAAATTAPAATRSAAPRTTASSATRSGTGTTTASAQGTAAGTYTYDSTGTVTVFGGTQDASGTTTFTVSPLSGGSQTTTMKNDHSTTEEHVVPRSTGLYLSYLHIAAPGAFDVEFQLSPAALLLPSPATVGKKWGWKATSTDGKTTATQSSQVVRTETLVIGGKQVPTVVVQTHLVLSGSVSYTADVTNWVSPSYRLVVKDHQVGSGKASFGSYSSDITDVVRSVRPA
jgi:hypothetical protein